MGDSDYERSEEPEDDSVEMDEDGQEGDDFALDQTVHARKVGACSGDKRERSGV